MEGDTSLCRPVRRGLLYRSAPQITTLQHQSVASESEYHLTSSANVLCQAHLATSLQSSDPSVLINQCTKACPSMLRGNYFIIWAASRRCQHRGGLTHPLRSRQG
ncbi:hypothetical protein N7G274_007954 [Stereocaulon virgatum]|uniref:Uncharacterized protein n=1 Tax=Stereocaulon virgatum TaxID=373712 RepID=A0ABR4A2W3_9LECA